MEFPPISPPIPSAMLAPPTPTAMPSNHQDQSLTITPQELKSVVLGKSESPTIIQALESAEGFHHHHFREGQHAMAGPGVGNPNQEAYNTRDPNTQSDPFAAGKITISQQFRKMDFLELCGCEMKNLYKITENDKNGREVGYITEKSGCCQRLCCMSFRPLEFFIHDGGKEGPVIASMKKNCHLGCWYPCLRPHFDVYDGNYTKPIGNVHDHCAFCNLTQKINDSNGKVVYKTNGQCCQPGLLCTCIQCILTADIPILSADDSGKELGMITKDAGGCKEFWAGYNNFTVKFPPGANLEQKKLIIASAMLFDLEYFEQGGNNGG